MHEVTLPTDTSGGQFFTLAEVGEQDAQIAAHWPILKTKFNTLSKAVKDNESVDEENRADFLKALDDIRGALDDVIKEEEKKGSKWNPFD